MQMWIDADACPSDVKDVMFNVARRTGIPLTLVANSPVHIPRSDVIRFQLVKAGANVADQKIAEQVHADDLVITADIPLANDVIAKGAYVVEPRGDLLDKNNIGSRLATRNFLEEFRAAGAQLGGPPPYSPKDKQRFANQIDRLISSIGRGRDAPAGGGVDGR